VQDLLPPIPERRERSIRSLELLWTVRKSLISHNWTRAELLEALIKLGLDMIKTHSTSAVKFDTEQLPEILNALETDNGGNKLILEVSVRSTTINKQGNNHSECEFSNIWARVLYDALLWMVSIFHSQIVCGVAEVMLFQVPRVSSVAIKYPTLALRSRSPSDPARLVVS
jgi:hypothetical protein